ncbi:MAG: hypothetical protein LBE81_01665 [Azonexus sp.]|jgi:hypothetical protein|uniref:hypothetical protein n=1 Tax=Azonexus sp. TaxID=1872668 RepID=UPI0028250FB7|nr:hypothetical protein [Azonexus sp.]MDR0775333.1 hypothetical protein [Azonexus sp.]
MSAIVHTANRFRFLRLGLLPGLLAASALPTLAQTEYVDAKGKPHASPVTATALTGGGATVLKSGWYLCNGPINYGNITISGAVNLILGNECRLNVVSNDAENAGISVTGAVNSLTIWAQSLSEPESEGDDGDRPSLQGCLTVNSGYWGAGIGGGHFQDGGTITINGGTVNANSGSVFGGGLGAGIGGGYGGAGGTITINEGAVSATSFGIGAGIGSGGNATNSQRNVGGMITINGGMVNATSGHDGGAGIGSGSNGVGGTITINDGAVNAASKGSGAGIGGGLKSDGGTIAIHGGWVIATAGGWNDSSGAGIGGGAGGAGGRITIDGGRGVAVSSGGGSAGIGSGVTWQDAPADAGTIIITMTENMTIATSSGGVAQAFTGGSQAEYVSGPGANIGQGGYEPNKAGAGVSPISIQPAETAVAAGGDAVFSVTSTTAGTIAPEIAYQWQQAKLQKSKSPDDESELFSVGKWSNVANGAGVAGATSVTLKLFGITASMNGNLYRCVVTVTGVGEKSSITYTTGSARLTVSQ